MKISSKVSSNIGTVKSVPLQHPDGFQAELKASVKKYNPNPTPNAPRKKKKRAPPPGPAKNVE